MPTGRVVQALDVIEEVSTGVVAGRVPAPLDTFGLRTREEPFQPGVVPAVAFATQAAVDAVSR